MSDLLIQTSRFQELREKKQKEKKEKNVDKLPAIIPILPGSRRSSSLGRRESKYHKLLESLSK